PRLASEGLMAENNTVLLQDVQEIVIDEEQLNRRIHELAAGISREYRGTEGLLLLCVLKGAYMFLADLSRLLTVPHEVDFMAVSLYGHGTASCGAVRIGLDLKEDVAGNPVLMYEDLIVSGRTRNYMPGNRLYS